MAKGTKKKEEPRVIPGTSDYVVRENAARKQLGVAGLAARNKQVPTAARAALREMTGIDISRKGVSVDPMGLAMALPVGKVLKAAKVLQAAGRAAEAAPLFARVAAKVGGRVAKKASAVGNAGRGPFSMKNAFKEQSAVSKLTSGRTGSVTAARKSSESVFPKLPNRGGDSPSLLRGSRDSRTFDAYADPYNIGNERVMGGVVRKPSGNYGEAVMPRIASKLPKPKLPKNRGGR